MKKHSKRYMLVLRTWGGCHKETVSYDEYDTIEELKEGEKFAKALYADTPKPKKADDYWYSKAWEYPEGSYWWGYIMLDFDEQRIIGHGGKTFPSYDNKPLSNLRIKDDFFRGDDEIPKGFCWHQGEYEGWLQFRWGDGKNALDYKPKENTAKQPEPDNEEFGYDYETEGLDEWDKDYDNEVIQTTFQDLIDKEKLERIKERW
jgi:hypothetical protein